VNNEKKMTPQEFELNRLKECERAWCAVYDLCLEQDPEFGRKGETGLQCVLNHIRALGDHTKIARSVK
jgi:hypothetical protein